jgi:hypothetical protein
MAARLILIGSSGGLGDHFFGNRTGPPFFQSSLENSRKRSNYVQTFPASQHCVSGAHGMARARRITRNGAEPWNANPSDLEVINVRTHRPLCTAPQDDGAANLILTIRGGHMIRHLLLSASPLHMER